MHESLQNRFEDKKRKVRFFSLHLYLEDGPWVEKLPGHVDEHVASLLHQNYDPGGCVVVVTEN